MRLALLCGLLVVTAAVGYSADGPTFEVASVKLADPNAGSDASSVLGTGGPGTSDPGHFRASRINMLLLLTKAFGVEIDQISGPWKYKAGDVYSIDAIVPPGATKEQFRKMLQNLLVERFHLVYRRETRDYPAYDLVVDKGGPKLKEVTPSQDPRASEPNPRPGDNSAPIGSDGFPIISGPRTLNLNESGLLRWKYQERSMEFLASSLSFLLYAYRDPGSGPAVQPRVKDKTGLTGIYTFVVEFGGGRSSTRTAGDGNSPQASDPRGPSLVEAVQKLGLRLEKTAPVTVEVISVESVDKVPTEN